MAEMPTRPKPYIVTPGPDHDRLIEANRKRAEAWWSECERANQADRPSLRGGGE